jgi:hypothetical protein
MGALTSRLREPAPADTPVACPRCDARFRAALTQGDCPVCGYEVDPDLRPPAADDDRPLVLAIGALAVNLVVFAVIVWAVLG